MTEVNESNLDDVKSLLNEIKDNPEILNENNDQIDELLKAVIKIEKRNLYGLEKSSAAKRRDEIFKYLDKKLEG